MQAKQVFWNSVGKKQLVGLTGLGLSGFVLMHMAGNMLILVGAKAYNHYGHAIVSNPLLYVAEVGLVVLFLVHIALALSLAKDNRAARPVAPYQLPKGEERASFASRTMVYSGLLILVFTILHLITFKYGPNYPVTYDGVEMRDLHRLVIEKFNEPLYFGWYLICLVVLGLHLSHGISASFQSLGLLSSKHPRLKCIAWGFAALVAGGFISQPFYAILCGGK